MVRRVELRAEGGEEADRAAAHAAVQCSRSRWWSVIRCFQFPVHLRS